jgi:hypothetical protein
MDTRRERVLATLLGGAGTVIGLLLYQAVPDLIRFPELELRVANGIAFLLVVFAIGALGGRVGHSFFLRIRGPIRTRAVLSGTLIGFAIAVAGWFITYLLRDLLFPFELFDGYERLLQSWLPNALIAGPVVGVLAAALVVRRLRRNTGLREPFEPPRMDA